MDCIECGTSFSGRADKKFCSDGCRNIHNNKKNRDITNLMRNINNRLRKNYRILCSLNDNKTKTSRNKLLERGFDFNYITEHIVYKNGSEYFFLYDQGYRFLDEDTILLVKKD